MDTSSKFSASTCFPFISCSATGLQEGEHRHIVVCYIAVTVLEITAGHRTLSDQI